MHANSIGLKKMRKIYLIILSIAVVIFLASFISSADEFTDFNDQLLETQNQIENIPKTPEEVKEQYLKQEWNKIFSTIPLIGPIHNFFLAHPLIFQILFNEAYSVSLTFILILILWIVTCKVIHRPAKESMNNVVAWTLAISVPIIFAHISLYKLIISKTLYFIFSQETFWLRTIIWFVVLIGLIIVLMIDEILTKKIKQSNEEKRKKELEQGIKESRTFVDTLKTYLGIVKKNE